MQSPAASASKRKRVMSSVVADAPGRCASIGVTAQRHASRQRSSHVPIPCQDTRCWMASVGWNTPGALSRSLSVAPGIVATSPGLYLVLEAFSS
eukprot:1411422-Prymnesium_polylepis.1